MWREEAHSQRGSRELLSRPERTQRAGGDGSDGARAVVRALTGGAELRAVDWRSGGDSGQASAEAEERPSGCGTSIAVTGGHRHRLVQMRTRVKNQVQAIALNEGIRRKKGLWSKLGRVQLESLSLAPWSARRRQDLLELLDRLNPKIDELSTAIQQAAEQRPEVQRLMTHPGVGPITALAFVLILGVPERFQCGKQVGSYLGLIPCEQSSGGRQRLGHLSKQGNTLLRFLLIESAHAVVRYEPDWRRRFLHLALRRGRSIAKVAMARKLAVRLYWMWRKGTGLSADFEVRFARGVARSWCMV